MENKIHLDDSFIPKFFEIPGDSEDVSLRATFRCIFFRRFGSERVSGVEHNLKETRAGGQAMAAPGWTCAKLMGGLKSQKHQILICICLSYYKSKGVGTFTGMMGMFFFET